MPLRCAAQISPVPPGTTVDTQQSLRLVNEDRRKGEKVAIVLICIYVSKSTDGDGGAQSRTRRGLEFAPSNREDSRIHDDVLRFKMFAFIIVTSIITSYFE